MTYRKTDTGHGDSQQVFIVFHRCYDQCQEQKADVGKAEDALEAVRKENQQKAQEIMQTLGLASTRLQIYWYESRDMKQVSRLTSRHGLELIFGMWGYIINISCVCVYVCVQICRYMQYLEQTANCQCID